MDAAERGRSREERLFKALLGEMAELQSELGSAEQPRRLGLRLEISGVRNAFGTTQANTRRGHRGAPSNAGKIASTLSRAQKARAVCMAASNAQDMDIATVRQSLTALSKAMAVH